MREEIKKILENYKKIVPFLFQLGKGKVIFIWGSVAITAVIPTISTILMQYMINYIQMENREFKQILVLFILYILCDIFLSVIAIWSNYVSMILQQRLNVEIDIKIIGKIKKLGLQDFETSESYNRLQRAKAQTGTQVFNYFSHITGIVKAVVLVLGAVYILLSWSVWPIIVVSTISVINMVLLFKLNRYQYEILRKRTAEEREKWYYQYVLTNDIAFKEIKTYGLHLFFENKFLKIAQKFLQQDKEIAKKNAHIGEIKTFLEQSTNIIVLGKIFWDTYCGKMLIGSTIAYIKAITNIKSNVNNLFMEIASIYKESLYMSQLFEFLEMETAEKNNGKQKIECIKEVKICHLNYKYKNSTSYVLKDINMEIHKGEKLVIVGKNGSGKSTLVKVVAGFYEDYEGDIFINGTNFHEIDKESYRKCLGILFQDYNKYELTVKENIGVGSLEKINEKEDIIDALKKANAPQGLIKNIDQQIGCWFKNGRQLSGGEWLRVAIGRSFFRDAELYILDEPNAALDPIGESNIVSSIQKVLASKSCIVITHHVNNIERITGEVIVMDGGRIIDKGMHKELIESCELYKEMYHKSINLK